MSNSVWPRPWDSPGKNTGVGCHFLLQCIKVKSESEVAQPCPTLCNPMDCSLPGSSVHGIFQARVLDWGAIAFSSQEDNEMLLIAKAHFCVPCYVCLKNRKWLEVGLEEWWEVTCSVLLNPSVAELVQECFLLDNLVFTGWRKISAEILLISERC